MINMELPDAILNGCDHIEEGCPIIAGNIYTYSVDLKPENDFPIHNISVIVELSLLGDNSQVITCVALDAFIP